MLDVHFVISAVDGHQVGVADTDDLDRASASPGVDVENHPRRPSARARAFQALGRSGRFAALAGFAGFARFTGFAALARLADGAISWMAAAMTATSIRSSSGEVKG